MVKKASENSTTVEGHLDDGSDGISKVTGTPRNVSIEFSTIIILIIKLLRMDFNRKHAQ